jgi:hypothetical protein
MRIESQRDEPITCRQQVISQNVAACMLQYENRQIRRHRHHAPGAS